MKNDAGGSSDLANITVPSGVPSARSLRRAVSHAASSVGHYAAQLAVMQGAGQIAINLYNDGVDGLDGWQAPHDQRSTPTAFGLHEVLIVRDEHDAVTGADAEQRG